MSPAFAHHDTGAPATHPGGQRSEKMAKYSGLKIGQRVMCNGYEGTVTRLCEWSDTMIEVRLARGGVCVCSSTVKAI